ncbi:uncharacterized protein LOC117298257 [Asterias rubens]|uniref:uncharacterized protein LOC117298257 n=1 Tax=Asterias rubens TaxID=7604 RepID=UPI001454F1B1|nr:uncharacterized protein LOC117298257 [Asterias rubens]
MSKCHAENSTLRPDSEFGATEANAAPNANEDDGDKTCCRSCIEGGARRWVVTLSAFVVHMMTSGFVKSLGVFFVTWQEVFDEGAASVGWISSLAAFAMLSTGPFAAALSKRFGCRPVAMIGGFWATASVVVASRASFLYQLILLMISAGIGLGLVYQPSIIIISFYFKTRLAAVMGISFSGVGIGIVAFPPLMTVLLDWYGWQGAMLIMASITTNLCVAGALYHPSTREKEQLAIHREQRKLHTTQQVIGVELAQNANSEKGEESEQSSRARRGSFVNEGLRLTEPTVATEKQGGSTSNNFEENSQSGTQTAPRPEIKGENLDGDSQLVKQNDYPAPNQQRRRSEVIFTVELSEASRQQNQNGDITTAELVDTKRCCNPCSYLVTTFQLGLLVTNLRLLALCIVAFLFGLGYYAALVYTVSRAVSIDIASTEAALLASIIGAGSFAGRLSHGVFIVLKLITPSRMMALMLLVMSASCLVLPFTKSFETMAIYAVFFGVSSGAANTLFPVLAHQSVKESKAGNSIGLYMMFLGLGDVAGVLVVGGLFDFTGSYDTSYITAGIVSFVCFIIVALEPLLKKPQHKYDATRRRRRQSQVEQAEVRRRRSSQYVVGISNSQAPVP